MILVMRIIKWWLPGGETRRPACVNTYEAKSLQLTLTACCLAPIVLNIWSYLRLPDVCYPVADLPCRNGSHSRWNDRPCSAALPRTFFSKPISQEYQYISSINAATRLVKTATLDCFLNSRNLQLQTTDLFRAINDDYHGKRCESMKYY